MAFAGGLGAEAALSLVPFEEQGEGGVRDEVLLFSESPSRFVCEVRPEHAEAFAQAMGRAPHARIGRVTEAQRLDVRGLGGGAAIDDSIEALREAFVAPLRGGAR
jgi:phosphoribosylformylglycinamidine synthase